MMWHVQQVGTHSIVCSKWAHTVSCAANGHTQYRVQQVGTHSIMCSKWAHTVSCAASGNTQYHVQQVGAHSIMCSKWAHTVSYAASGRTQILLRPKLSSLCVICVTTKISCCKVKYDQYLNINFLYIIQSP
jgi:hypothetical protein